MPGIHLCQPKIGKYGACGPFTKHPKRIQNFLNTGKLDYIYKNELDKACFQHNMTYNKYQDLERRIQSDIVLKNKAFNIASDLRKNGYERGLTSMVFKFFYKKSKGSGLENQQLANELHKPIIKRFKKRKVYSSFKDNIWGVDLADIQLISNYNNRIKYLSCVIDLLSKYA